MAENKELDLQAILSDKKLVDSYGTVSKGSINSRESITLDSGRTIRGDFNQADYNYYRSAERVPTDIEESITICNKIYTNTPFVRSIIDMMADFTVQGIRIEHKDPKVQNFLNKWMTYIDFNDVCERIANMLYRVGNAPVYITYGKPSVKYRNKWSKADIDVSSLPVYANRIPMRYKILFPTSLNVVGGTLSTIGKPLYGLKITNEMRFDLSQLNKTLKDLNISADLIEQINKGADTIPLNEESIDVLFYKKDSWLKWASPMVHAIIEPIFMLNKMKLCDKKAVDGLLSQVRLWNIGSLEHRLYPTEYQMRGLRNLLSSVSGGEVADIVWGPELSFKESDSKGYNFLKPEKYEHVMREIYAGLGVPPGLTGSQNNGSASNNSVSMKTLIERLEYGRRVILTFWRRELEKLTNALGWKSTPLVSFDYKVLSDENLERKLLIDLWDRDIISNEKLRQLCRQDHKLEEMRIAREQKMMEGGKIPDKASPYHNPNSDIVYNKQMLDSGQYTPAELGIDKTLTKPLVEQNTENVSEDKSKQKETSGDNGRPFGAKDQYQRKRNDQNKSKSFIELAQWAESAQKTIANLLNKTALENFNKKKLPELTKAELNAYEQTKSNILSHLKPFQEIILEDIVGYVNTPTVEYEQTLADLLLEEDTLTIRRKKQAEAYAITYQD